MHRTLRNNASGHYIGGGIKRAFGNFSNKCTALEKLSDFTHKGYVNMKKAGRRDSQKAAI